MESSRFLGIGLLLLLGVARVAADVAGTSKAAFDTQKSASRTTRLDSW